MKALHIDSLETVVCTVKCLDLHMFSLSLDMVVEFLRRFPCLEKLCIEVCCFFFIGSSFRLAALSSTYLVLKCCFLLIYVLFRVAYQEEKINIGSLNTRILSDVLMPI